MRLIHGLRLTALATALAIGICLLPEITLGAGDQQPDGRPKLILDADTANEIDDLYAIIRREKLYVVCIGASTNLASAFKLKPEIAPRIKAYVLGFKYNRATGVWNKSEFNVRRDLNAADFLLNQKELELHVMSANVAGAFTFARDDTFRRRSTMGELGQYLTQRWKSRTPAAKTWVMWDVTAVEALVHPEMAGEERVMTPPENTQRKVWMYHAIDVDRMRADFWEAALSTAR